MDRIAKLLAKATPNLGRRDHLRDVFAEWERVKNAESARKHIYWPLVIREAPQRVETETGTDAGEQLESGAVMEEVVPITAMGSEEFREIQEELADAGVPAKVERPVQRSSDPTGA